MEAYSGFEPRVGEIRAVRTFRIGPGGRLYPLFSNAPWPDGTHTARCAQTRHSGTASHVAPDPDCTCGFYAYASAGAAAEHPHSHHVLAVVACWGHVIAGTRGIRAEHARIDAIWMSAKVPPNLTTQVVDRYPSAQTYARRSDMFAAHSLTTLDCYEPEAPHERAVNRLGLRVVTATALVLGTLPAHWLGSNQQARIVWGAELGFFLIGAALMGRRSADIAAKRRALVSLAVALWLLAPFAGPVGIVLLRLPLLQIAALTLIHRMRMMRAANQFPADIRRSMR
jgi:hypothetical protein